MKFRFPVVIIDEDFRSENTSGLGIRALAAALEKEGMEVLGVTSYGDLSQFAQQQSRASAFILSIDDEEFSSDLPGDAPVLVNLRNFISEIRFKNSEIPIYLYGETRTSSHIPNDILRELHGFIHMFEDTPEFVARHIIREAKSYLDSLAPPFFRALVHYASDGSYSWHCPGHSGGVAFLKSPVGQMFHQFFGENLLRADVCNSVDELGPAPRPLGPGGGLRAQCRAHLQRRRPVLRHQRHVDVEQDGVARHGGAGRRRHRRPQLPRIDPACDHDDRRDTRVPAADAQQPRHHRTDSQGGVPLGEHPEKNPRASVRPQRQDQAAHPDLDAEHLRRRAVQRRHHQGFAGHACRHAALRRGLAAARGIPRVLPGNARDRPRSAALEGGADLRHAIDAQAAGRPVAGVADPGAGLRDAAARQAPLQRGVPDAHVDVAAVRDHRVLRRRRGDDGAAGRQRAGRGVDQGGAGLPPRDAQGRRRVRRLVVVQGLGTEGPAGGRHRHARGLGVARGRALAWLRRPRRRLQHARPDQGDGAHARPGRRGRFLRRRAYRRPSSRATCPSMA